MKTDEYDRNMVSGPSVERSWFDKLISDNGNNIAKAIDSFKKNTLTRIECLKTNNQIQKYIMYTFGRDIELEQQTEYMNLLFKIKRLQCDYVLCLRKMLLKITVIRPLCVRFQHEQTNTLPNDISLDAEVSKSKSIMECIEQTTLDLSRILKIHKEARTGTVRDDVGKQTIDLDRVQRRIGEIYWQKSIVESDFNFYHIRTEHLVKLTQDIRTIQNSCEAKVQILTQNLTKTSREKANLLKETNARLNATFRSHQALRLKLDDEYAANLNELNDRNANQLNRHFDIMGQFSDRHYHVIFVLDESSSMSANYDLVVEKTMRIIENRRISGHVDDIVSVIKFNDHAYVEKTSVRVTEKWSISKIRGGGTSFVAAVEKLDQIIDTNKVDSYLPVIFFLSDGKDNTPKSTLKRIKEIQSKHNTNELLFFTVALGLNAHTTLLREMCSLFNKGIMTLNIQNQHIHMYNYVESQIELVNAFKAFEKLFDYQKNYLDVKLNTIQMRLDENETVWHLTIRPLDDLKSLATDSTHTINDSNLTNDDYLNVEYNRKIQNLNDIMKKCAQVCDNLNGSKQEYQHCASRIEIDKNTLQSQFDDEIKLYDKLNETETNAFTNETSTSDGDTDIDTDTDDDNDDDVWSTNENQIKNSNEDSGHFACKTENNRRLLKIINNRLKFLLGEFECLNERLKLYRFCFRFEQDKNHLWKLVKEYYVRQRPIDQNCARNDLEILEDIVRLKISDSKQLEPNELNLVLRTLFTDNGSEIGLVMKSLEKNMPINSYMNQMKVKLERILTMLKNFQSNDQLAEDEKDDLKTQLTQVEKQINFYESHDIMIGCVLEVLNNMLVEVKQKLACKSILLENLIELMTKLETEFSPFIEILERTYRSVYSDKNHNYKDNDCNY